MPKTNSRSDLETINSFTPEIKKHHVNHQIRWRNAHGCNTANFFFFERNVVIWLTEQTEFREYESAFAPYVGFGVLMTSNLGTNVILMRYVTAVSPMKELKS
jgi:hypothetical protein